MKYRAGQRFGLPHKRQSYIYFTCVNYEYLSPAKQKLIEQLCFEVGGEYYAALLEAVTTEERLLDTAMNHYMSEMHLSRFVKKFYKIANERC